MTKGWLETTINDAASFTSRPRDVDLNTFDWMHTNPQKLPFKTTLNKLMTGSIRTADLDIDAKEVEG